MDALILYLAKQNIIFESCCFFLYFSCFPYLELDCVLDIEFLRVIGIQKVRSNSKLYIRSHFWLFQCCLTLKIKK